MVALRQKRLVRPRPTAAAGRRLPARGEALADRPVQRGRSLVVSAVFFASFLAVGGQVAVLAAKQSGQFRLAGSAPVAGSYARPDLIDRAGRLLATDVAVPSLFADPSLVISRDEVAEKLGTVFPDLDQAHVRAALSDRTKRFAWLKRHVPPATAQKIHNLGLPGLDFRKELARAYPLERLGGHVLGSVDIDNKGLAGIERYVDGLTPLEAVHGATRSDRPPVRLTLDVGVQHAVDAELRAAIARYKAKAAVGLVMDIKTGAMRAAVSLPGIDPGRPAEALKSERRDRIQSATYELGSIFKTATLALALENGASLADTLDLSEPLRAGPHVIRTKPSARGVHSVGDVFARSLNVGSGLLALSTAPDQQKAFYERIGLWTPLRTEVGTVAASQLPHQIGRAEQITLSYGHGFAVAPLQAAAALAGLVNGGTRVTPTYIERRDLVDPSGDRVISADASASIREAFKLCVAHSKGTCQKADVPGYDVGGKTGTAEIPENGGYSETAVISSFVGAFPMRAPRYILLLSLFEPQPTAETGRKVTADLNAAPTAGLIIRRVAPLLGVLPDVSG